MAITSLPSFRGTFIQGYVTSLLLTIMNPSGIVSDPDSISITIVDSNNNLAINGSAIPIKVTTGMYAYDWSIDGAQTPGPYTATWTYLIGNDTFTATQSIIVAASGAGQTAQNYSRKVIEFRASLEIMIRETQCIPVHREEGIKNKDLTKVSFTFPRWNITSRIMVWKNNILVEDGITIDYDNGQIIFNTPLLSVDRVECSYNFRWFDDMDFDRFLSNALSILNIYPPQINYSLETVPAMYYGLILYGAAVDSIRRLLLALTFQTAQIVFGGPEMSDRAFKNFESLKKNYEDTWNEGLKQKKYVPYKGLTRQIVVPTMSLPGSRSRWFKELFS